MREEARRKLREWAQGQMPMTLSTENVNHMADICVDVCLKRISDRISGRDSL
jgi:hypothetical protein